MSLVAVLRAFHILGGTLWVGAAIFNTIYLIPSIFAAGPAGGQVMRILVQVRRMPVFMNSAMGVTLLSGIWLYGRNQIAFGSSWTRSSSGITFTVGAAIAILTAAIGHFGAVRTVKKLGQLSAEIAAAGSPTAAQASEMAALQRRMLVSARTGAALLALATIAMAIARYV